MAYEYLDGREEYTEENKIDWQEFIDRFNIYHDTVNGNILVNDADIPSRSVGLLREGNLLYGEIHFRLSCEDARNLSDTSSHRKL